MLPAVTTITFFFCGSYEINKNNRANATHRLSPVQKMFQDRTEAMLDQRGPGTGPVPVLTLWATVTVQHQALEQRHARC